MKKLIFSLIILAFLAGCTGDPQISTFNPRVGGEGVVMTFENNAPPTSLRAGDEFSLAFRLENRGATTTGAYISVFLNNFYISSPSGMTGTTLTDSIREITGRSEFFPQGERTVRNLGRYKINENIGERAEPTTTIRANICYPYETVFSTTVCIKTDYYSEERDNCQVRPSSHGSQGAPIAVSRVEPRMTPSGIGTFMGTQTFYNSDLFYIFNEVTNTPMTEEAELLVPEFKITLRNLGNGRAMLGEGNRLSLNSCSPSLYRGRIENTVIMEAFLGTIPLECDDEIITLEERETEVTCTLGVGMSLENFNPGPAYNELLTVNLQYIYTESIQREIRIRR